MSRDNDRARERYNSDPEYRERKKRLAREFNRRRPDKRRTNELKKRYGLTSEQVDRMLLDQGGGCAICMTHDPGRGKKWNVDHDHVTGNVRGLLCCRCNFMLGHARDNATNLRLAVLYLEKHED